MYDANLSLVEYGGVMTVLFFMPVDLSEEENTCKIAPSQSCEVSVGSSQN